MPEFSVTGEYCSAIVSGRHTPFNQARLPGDNKGPENKQVEPEKVATTIPSPPSATTGRCTANRLRYSRL